MNFVDTLAFFGIMVALAALPSSSVALVVARTATLGTANGIAVGIGIVLGDLVFVALAIVGLAVVAETLGGFFVVVKVAGGLYLVWLGMRMLLARPAPPRPSAAARPSRSLLASLVAGFVLTLGDVKAILFYASLFPVFFDLAAIGAGEVATIVVVTIVAVGGVKVAYALLGARMAGVAARGRFAGAYQRSVGGIMVGAGAYLALKA